MSFFSDITRHLLAGRTLGRVNTGIAKGNPYGVGGPADPNPTLPPEAYGPGGPPAGYGTSTAATGPNQYPDINSLPPAATNVIPGSAYPEMPHFGGEPSVIVHQPYQDPGVAPPEPYVPPDWVYPGSAGSTPPQADLGPPLDWGGMPLASLGQTYPGPGYTDPSQAGQWAQGLADWNAGGWMPNVSDPEAGQGQDQELRAMINAHRLAQGKSTFDTGGGRGSAPLFQMVKIR